MPSRSLPQRLTDVLENASRARKFVGDLSAEEFRRDRMTTYATMRCLGIVAEASSHVPPSMKDKYPDVHWRRLSQAGRVYPVPDPTLVWDTVQDELAPLEAAVQAELDALGPGDE